jgi:uncharacterized membrane protein YtjA (UPF0391 family)
MPIMSHSGDQRRAIMETPAATGRDTSGAGCREAAATDTQGRSTTMLGWAVVFFIIAIIAGAFGFGGIAAGAAGIAKILFFIFLVIFVISLILHFVGGRRRP